MDTLLSDRAILEKAIKFQDETIERLSRKFNYHNSEAQILQATVERLWAQRDEKQKRLEKLNEEIAEQIPTLQRQLV
jgi:uncharacterized coiled-coil protein SlyX